jgi:ABC-2 type transport system permease protein
MLAAPHRSALLAGYALTAMVRSLGVVVLVFGVALVSGMQVGGNGIDLAGLVLLGLMVNLTTTLWAGGFALRTRTIQAAPAMQIPVFLILFMAPVYVPLNLLKGWIHTAASINPTTVLLETGRGFVAGQRTHTALAYAVAAALVLAFAAWALRGMRHAEAAG